MDEFDLEDMSRRMSELQVRQRQRLEQAVAEHGPQNSWTRREAQEIFTLDGEECWIVKPRTWDEFDEIKKKYPDMRGMVVGYNGYVRFQQKPVIEPGFHGIVAYVPVHGGITYCVHDEIGSVYGFDTAHHDSEEFPIRDIDWIKKNILLMILGIREAAKIEPEYLKADGDNRRRAQLVQPLVDLADGLNFLTMLNLLTGEL